MRYRPRLGGFIRFLPEHSVLVGLVSRPGPPATPDPFPAQQAPAAPRSRPPVGPCGAALQWGPAVGPCGRALRPGAVAGRPWPALRRPGHPSRVRRRQTLSRVVSRVHGRRELAAGPGYWRPGGAANMTFMSVNGAGPRRSWRQRRPPQPTLYRRVNIAFSNLPAARR